jgi:hypothetical protein
VQLTGRAEEWRGGLTRYVQAAVTRVKVPLVPIVWEVGWPVGTVEGIQPLAKFEVLVAGLMKIQVWYMTPCNLVYRYPRFAPSWSKPVVPNLRSRGSDVGWRDGFLENSIIMKKMCI